jgi:hypothetical protein
MRGRSGISRVQQMAAKMGIWRTFSFSRSPLAFAVRDRIVKFYTLC